MRTVLHSYSFRNYPLDHVLDVARTESWSSVELSCWHFARAGNGVGIGEALKAAQRSDVQVHCVGYWGDFVTRDEDNRRRSIELACRTVETCADYGVALINGSGGWLVSDRENASERYWSRNGSSIATEEDFRRAVAAYQELAEVAASVGVTVAIEIHPNTIHDTVRSTCRLVTLIDRKNVVVTADPSNAAAFSFEDRDPAIMKMLGDRLGYFHLKNCVLDGGTANFDTDAHAGVVDNYRWLNWLECSTALRDVCIEYCGEGDPHGYVGRSRAYLDRSLGHMDRLRRDAVDRFE